MEEERKVLSRESRRAVCLRHEHLICLDSSLPSEPLASCVYHALQASVHSSAAHGQWYGIGGHPVNSKGATESRQSRCSASNQACRWRLRGPAPGGCGPESLRGCSSGETPCCTCCHCEFLDSFPAGAPGQVPRLRHQRRHHFFYWIEPSKEHLARVMSPAPLAFCRVKCEGSYVVHFCRSIDAPSCQIISLRLI